MEELKIPVPEDYQYPDAPGVDEDEYTKALEIFAKKAHSRIQDLEFQEEIMRARIRDLNEETERTEQAFRRAGKELAKLREILDKDEK